MCRDSRKVYDALIKCEGEFVGHRGEEVKKYTEDIVNGVNSRRENFLEGKQKVKFQSGGSSGD